MFPESVEYTEENVEIAIAQIQTFKADMCGNYEYGPLKWIFDKEPEYPRSVFLISDGGVSNANQLYSIIKANVKNSRLHAFGIGRGAEKDIIMNLAKSGKGVHEFVEENETFQHKVVAVIRKSMLPALSKWQITMDGSPELAPSPSLVPVLYSGESFSLYAIFPNAESIPTMATMTAFNTKSCYTVTFEVPINKDLTLEGDSLHKLWATMKIKELNAKESGEKIKNISI